MQVNGTEADYEYEDITLERVRSFLLRRGFICGIKLFFLLIGLNLSCCINLMVFRVTRDWDLALQVAQTTLTLVKTPASSSQKS